MQDETIAFVGGGNMASSLIGGLLADGCPSAQIRVSDRSDTTLKALEQRYSVATSHDNRQTVAGADLIVIAVKPQAVHDVTTEIADLVRRDRPLVLSIAAGVREQDMNRWLGGDAALVRTMPNTPALVQSGATALFANDRVSEPQKELAETVMRAVGLTVWLDDEQLMDAVTALSGGGPAYLFLVMEAMQSAARNLGLPDTIARLLTLQTTLGAARLALESSEDVATLRKHVTSPGGTTEKAIGVLQAGGLEALFEQAVQAAHQRARELAGTLGEKA